MGYRHLQNSLHILLQDCYRKPHPLCIFQRRRYSNRRSNQNEIPTDIGIVGAGITGLTSAYLLSQALPQARISVLESQHRLGGWLQSSRVEVDDGFVIFEHGPRTLRPAGASAFATLDLIRRLGLQDKVLSTSKVSEAARNRYIYYPDHLVLMPGPGQSMLNAANTIAREPMFNGFTQGVLFEIFRRARSDSLQDESVGSFLSRRFSTSLADNIVSAVIHGIYAGDIYKLSVKSLSPLFWHYEGSRGSVMSGALSSLSAKTPRMTRKDQEFTRKMRSKFFDESGKIHGGLEPFEEIMKASVYTFNLGLEQLARAIAGELEKAPNVQLLTGKTFREAKLIEKENSGEARLEVTSEQGQQPLEFSHLLDTTGGLKPLTPSQTQNSQHADSSFHFAHYSTVMVVNLYFPPPMTLPVRGFGYLIPRSLPFSQNPEFALGVVFDSDATPAQGTAQGTRLTVMLGGHWWQDWISYPTAEEGVKMARAVLQRHLGISAFPTATRAVLQKHSIPQYTVGYTEKMQAMHDWLLESYQGRYRVAGAACHGVGVNDCIRSAYVAANELLSGNLGTGLEDYGKVDFDF